MSVWMPEFYRPLPLPGLRLSAQLLPGLGDRRGRPERRALPGASRRAGPGAARRALRGRRGLALPPGRGGALPLSAARRALPPDLRAGRGRAVRHLRPASPLFPGARRGRALGPGAELRGGERTALAGGGGAAVSLRRKRGASGFSGAAGGPGSGLPGVAAAASAPDRRGPAGGSCCGALPDTEPIDEHWPRELDHRPGARAPAGGGRRPGPISGSTSTASTGSWSGWRTGGPSLAAYARLCTDLLVLRDALEPDTAGHLRRLSEQIEYSTENVDRLLH